MAFHDDAGATAHDGLGHEPLAIDLLCLGADLQGAGGVAEGYGGAITAAGGQIDQGTGNGCRRADGHRAGAHHGVVQLAHGQRAHQQVHVTSLDLLATGGLVVLRLRHERNLRRVLACQRLFRRLDQAHAQRTGHADFLEPIKLLRITVDIFAQLGALIADVLGVNEHSGDAGADHGRLEGADARHVELIHQIAGGEHRAALLAVVRRVHELEHDFRGRESDAVQFEVAGFLHLAVGDRHVRDDGFVDVGLPDADNAGAVFRHA